MNRISRYVCMLTFAIVLIAGCKKVESGCGCDSLVKCDSVYVSLGIQDEMNSKAFGNPEEVRYLSDSIRDVHFFVFNATTKRLVFEEFLDSAKVKELANLAEYSYPSIQRKIPEGTYLFYAIVNNNRLIENISDLDDFLSTTVSIKDKNQNGWYYFMVGSTLKVVKKNKQADDICLVLIKVERLVSKITFRYDVDLTNKIYKSFIIDSVQLQNVNSLCSISGKGDRLVSGGERFTVDVKKTGPLEKGLLAKEYPYFNVFPNVNSNTPTTVNVYAKLDGVPYTYPIVVNRPGANLVQIGDVPAHNYIRRNVIYNIYAIITGRPDEHIDVSFDVNSIDWSVSWEEDEF